MGWMPFNSTDGLTPIQIEKLNNNFSDMADKIAYLNRNKTQPMTTFDAWPIGSIYMSDNNTNPTNLFGGTWDSVPNSIGVYMWKRTA